MAAQQEVVLTASQTQFVEKIEGGAGAIIPRRLGTTTAFVHYVQKHRDKVLTYIASSRCAANSFAARVTDTQTECTVAIPRGGSPAMYIFDCSLPEETQAVVSRSFVVFSPCFTPTQAAGLPCAGVNARMFVTYLIDLQDRIPATNDASLSMTATRVVCREDIRVGDDLHACTTRLHAKLIAWIPGLCGPFEESLYITEPVYLSADDVIVMLKLLA